MSPFGLVVQILKKPTDKQCKENLLLLQSEMISSLVLLSVYPH